MMITLMTLNLTVILIISLTIRPLPSLTSFKETSSHTLVGSSI